jgi:hypothetical protein
MSRLPNMYQTSLVKPDKLFTYRRKNDIKNVSSEIEYETVDWIQLDQGRDKQPGLAVP